MTLLNTEMCYSLIPSRISFRRLYSI